VIISRCAAVGALFAAAAFAQNLSDFEKHVTEFTLERALVYPSRVAQLL
jgi:hypothetical protein